MPLDQQDSSILDYKPQIRYYQKRIAELDSGFINPVVAAQTPVDSDVYIQNLKDLGVKADSLSKRIDDESTGLRIPVNPVTEQSVAAAVLAIDPDSGGNYISYETYNKCISQVAAGVSNLNSEDLISSSSNDEASNSQLVQSTIYSGYAAYLGQPVSSQSSYSDIIQSWGGVDGNIQKVINFSDNYLNSFPDTQYLPWAFKSDTVSESAQISSFINLWNSSSSTGSKALSILGGVLQNSEPLSPDPDLTAATDTYLKYTNDALNNINNLLDNSWSSELMCCFLNFLVATELKTILAFIALLSMLKSMVNLDFKDLLVSFRDVLTNMMRNLIINTLLNIVMQIYQRVVQPIENWINSEVNTLNQLASMCPVVEKFVQTYIVSAVQNAEKQFKGMIVELMKNIELKKIQSSAKLSLATTCNWINQSVKAMNLVSQIMKLAQSSVSQIQNEGSDIANQAISLIPSKSPYSYPTLSNPNLYNTFPVPLQQNIPNPIGILNCGSNLPQSLVPASPQWTLSAGTAQSNIAPSTSTNGYTLST